MSRSPPAAARRCAAFPRSAPGGPSGRTGRPRSAGRTRTRTRRARAAARRVPASARTWSPGPGAGTPRGWPRFAPFARPPAGPRAAGSGRLSFRASALRSVRAAAGRAAPGGCLIARAARSNSSAPSVSMSSTSWPRGNLDARVVVPVRDRIGPRLDVKVPGALAGHGHVRPVAVRARRELAHANQRAGLARRISEHHAGAERAVSLSDDSRADLEGLAGDGLGGAAPALHHGLDIENGDASDHAVTVPSCDS
jgi:hypothetical protein